MSDAVSDQLGIALGIDPKAKGDRRVDADAVIGLVKAAESTITRLSGLAGGDIVREVAICVAQILETRLRDIAIGAWNQRKEIRKYTNAKEYPADKEYRVKLKEHTVKWTYRPYIEIKVGQLPATKIPFLLLVEVTLGGPVVLIKGGCYRAIEFGAAKVVGKLKLDQVELWSKPSRAFELPGQISLGGIPIGTTPADLQPAT